MKEFLTIGELADIFNMDVQLLRHYDAKGLLVPQVRNSENNRRFYHFDQEYLHRDRRRTIFAVPDKSLRWDRSKTAHG